MKQKASSQFCSKPWFRFLIVLLLSSSASWAAPNAFDGTIDTDWSKAGNWDLELPGTSAGNTAIVQNQRTVDLTTDFAGVNSFDATIRDGSTLNISADLSNVGFLRAGNNDGHFGTINHSTGTVSASSGIIVGEPTGTATQDSNYNHTGGTVNTAGIDIRQKGKLNISNNASFNLGSGGNSSIRSGGEVRLNGGTLTINKDSENVTVDGDGLLLINSGTFTSQGTDPGDLLTMHNDVRVVDGTVNLAGQNYFGGEFRVVGDAATIQIDRLNSSATVTTDFVFEMDSDGISAITNTNWMSLEYTTITVDATAYTGGAGTFTLFDTNNLAQISDGSLSVIGLANGLTGQIIQDENNDIVTLRIVPEPGQAALLLGCIAVGFVLLLRRLKPGH